MSDISQFIDGLTRFQQHHYGENRELADELKAGQKPKALMIGCSDSRVDPALLTNCAQGDLFMVRNVANLVPPYETNPGFHGVSSALEYAVCSLEVEHIIIMGHSGCGGIGALLETAQGTDVGEFVGKWVNIAAAARDKILSEMADKTPEERARACEKESILVSLKNLLTFPWIKERVSTGKLSLHGWYYGIASGRLSYYNPYSGEFEVQVASYNEADKKA